MADDGEVEFPFAENTFRKGFAAGPGFRTMSIRSWLSDSIIS